jgi:hypothetical protein
MQRLGYSTQGSDGKVNYFRDVIEANAYNFWDPDSNSTQKWLDVAWAGTGSAPPSYEETQTNFTENSWTMSADVYAGFGGGGGIDIFGLGVESSFSLMAGFTYDTETEVSTETTKTWGIELGDYDCPSGPITSYTWRIYFLPPPQANPSEWTQELIQNFNNVQQPGMVNPAQIDPNSGAWKIVFIVTQIYTNGQQTYSYDGSLSANTGSSKAKSSVA